MSRKGKREPIALTGLSLAASQVYNGVRIAPILRDAPISDLRLDRLYVWSEDEGARVLREGGVPNGNALDLGGHPPEAWVSALNEALALVKKALPGWHADLPRSVARIVPVGFGAERHLSASYREAPSQVYMSLHPDPLTLAEAIVHEGQHGKLNRLLWLDPVLENGWSDWAPSPVRPDLRPLLGVLLAVHAFVPVALLHERLAEHPWPDPQRFVQRRAEVLAGNRNGLEILAERARPTPAGQRLLREIQALQARLETAGASLPKARTDTLPPG